MVDDDNDHFEDVLPDPETINFGFQRIKPWRQSGNLPVGKGNLKTVSTFRAQRMSCLEFFYQFYFMKYIKDVVIPETNKRLN